MSILEKEIEDRFAKLEERLAQIEENQARIMDLLRDRGLMPREDGVDLDTFGRAVAELAAGNRKTLSNYLKRGGKIPVAEKPKGKM